MFLIEESIMEPFISKFTLRFFKRHFVSIFQIQQTINEVTCLSKLYYVTVLEPRLVIKNVCVIVIGITF